MRSITPDKRATYCTIARPANSDDPWHYAIWSDRECIAFGEADSWKLAVRNCEWYTSKPDDVTKAVRS